MFSSERPAATTNSGLLHQVTFIPLMKRYDHHIFPNALHCFDMFFTLNHYNLYLFPVARIMRLKRMNQIRSKPVFTLNVSLLNSFQRLIMHNFGNNICLDVRLGGAFSPLFPVPRLVKRRLLNKRRIIFVIYLAHALSFEQAL